LISKFVIIIISGVHVFNIIISSLENLEHYKRLMTSAETNHLFMGTCNAIIHLYHTFSMIIFT